MHSVEDIERFMLLLDSEFKPPLSSYMDVKAFARKVNERAEILIVEHVGTIVGLLAFYCNDFQTAMAHITYLGVHSEFRRKGIAGELLKECVGIAETKGMKTIQVRTWKGNKASSRLYEESGFQKKRECADRADGSVSIWYELSFESNVQEGDNA